MALVSLSDLAGPELTEAQALERAEALIAAHLCPGLPDLGLHTWVADYRMRNDQRGLGVPLYGRRRLGPSVLRYWPVTALLSVTEDGRDRTAECVADTFSVRLDGLASEFAGLGTIRVTFQTGWNRTDLPDALKQAILLTAQDLLARPQGVVSERLGDVSSTYVPALGGPGLPPGAALLLAPWRHVGF